MLSWVARLYTLVRTTLGWIVGLTVTLTLIWVLVYRWVDPPTTPYMLTEYGRLGSIDKSWRDMEEIAPVMARSAVAAEDANFCLHWGFDVGALREAIEDGGGRGASSISQQVVKNVFLWHGRSWLRKGLEALLTPVMEAFWTKERIMEVYLNVAEFDEGVFGVEAASNHYFGRSADALTPSQAAALASILPAPKQRNATRLSPAMQRKARRVADGAATIRADGRAACFES
ncbi:MAG: monofunctional biosynthetic peptidoglycan transglycosylase [Pseudomonadota bacterium]